MHQTVLIEGDGIAACCCAHLLRDSGLEVRLVSSTRPKPPTILVSEATQALLVDIFEDPNLFRGSAAIRKRIVAWGQDATPVTLPHMAFVVSEQALLDRLWPQIKATEATAGQEADWRLFSSRTTPPLLPEEHFGSRIAQTQTVHINDSADRDACWVESLETGWLFLLPLKDGRGTLISVGGSPQEQLERSRLIGPHVAELQGTLSMFPAYPQILSQLCGRDQLGQAWLACGTAAMAFDPLCGEGAGNAAREAILAAAVIKASARGEAWEDLCAHYASRLLGGFLRHLSVCRGFYADGHAGPWWDRELALLDQGMEYVGAQSVNWGRVYRLKGFDLEPIETASGKR
jgi:2-polyprenyl-6-methoxyphenol hydroxylase-like FAD-dependent oxidoreductase